MYKLSFYVPLDHLETVKNALFQAGAGRYQHYDRCCWQVAGQGQFRPLPGSDPFIGSTGVEEKIPEYKVEMLCPPDRIKAIISALLSVHPYQEPAYEIYPILRIEDF
jgi:hypothetical protein